MANILFILMPTDFKDAEFTVPYQALIDAGHVVDVAGLNNNIAIGADGHEHQPNKVLGKISSTAAHDYDALVIPGGPGSPEHLWKSNEVLQTIRSFHSSAKLVAGICYACCALAQSGILSGKEATCYPDERAQQIFEKNDVTFVDTGCHINAEEKIITAQGPQQAAEFAAAILKSV